MARLDEAGLVKILRDYSDEPQAKRIAHAIIKARTITPILSTDVLARIVKDAATGRRARGASIHPATRTFQALRMAVNDEERHLEDFLPQAVEALRPGGRLAVITFHSGEDTLVKHFFREAA